MATSEREVVTWRAIDWRIVEVGTFEDCSVGSSSRKFSKQEACQSAQTPRIAAQPPEILPARRLASRRRRFNLWNRCVAGRRPHQATNRRNGRPWSRPASALRVLC